MTLGRSAAFVCLIFFAPCGLKAQLENPEADFKEDEDTGINPDEESAPREEKAIEPFSGYGKKLHGKTMEPVPFAVENCGDQTSAMISNINQAIARVDSCLAKLNPSLADEIHEILNARVWRFRCRWRQDESACGWTGHEWSKNQGGLIVIVTSKSLKATSTACTESGSIASIVFHELIHAADREERYMVSHDDHLFGFPDVVISCDNACYPGWLDSKKGDQAADAIKRAEKKFGVRVGESGGSSCPYKDDDRCRALRKYTHVCKTGKNLGSSELTE